MAVARHQSAVVRHSAGVARRLEPSCDSRHTTIRTVARHHCHTTPKPSHDTTVTRHPEASCGDSRMTPRGVARRHRHTTLWGVTRRRCGSVMQVKAFAHLPIMWAHLPIMWPRRPRRAGKMKSMTGTQVQAIAQSWPLLFVTCYILGTYGHSMMRRAWKEVELFLMHVHTR